MILKKVYRNIHLEINLMGDTTLIEQENVLEDICMTFSDVTALNSEEDFNSLILKQQKNKNHLLIAEPKPFDVLRILIKMINNYFIVTKQSVNFNLESLMYFGEDEIYAHGSEMYLKSIKNITFSPTIRSHWTNPQLINNLINL